MAQRPEKNVGIVMGSASDLEVARKATAILDQLGLGHELAVASAHRTPERTRDFVRACEEAGVEVFIAIAGYPRATLVMGFLFTAYMAFWALRIEYREPPTPYVPPSKLTQLDENYLFWRIKEGGPGIPKAGIGYRSAMPVWGGVMSDEEIWKVIMFEYTNAGAKPAKRK